MVDNSDNKENSEEQRKRFEQEANFTTMRNAEKAKSLAMDKEMRDVYRSINEEIQEELEYHKQIKIFNEEGNKFLRSKSDLEAASNSLKARETSLNEQIQRATKEQKAELEEQLKILNKIQSEVEKQKERRDEINQAVEEGGGKALTMLGKIPGLGKASEKGLAAMEQAMVNGASETEAMQAGLKEMKKEAMVMAGFMVMAFAAKSLKEYSNLQRDVGRQLAVSSHESFKIQQNFKAAAFNANDIFATTKALSEMNSLLNDARGTGLELDGKTLVTANKLLKTNVLSQEALIGVARVANATGQ